LTWLTAVALWRTGLVYKAVACAGLTGAASCPALANITIGLLRGSVVLLKHFAANSRLTFQVNCRVQ
jgi:hypothetical protein